MKLKKQTESLKPVEIAHQGNHHNAKLKVDPNTKDVKAGLIYNFSDNAAVMVEIRNKKAKGTFVHTGGSHMLKIDAKSDGNCGIEYKDKRLGNLEISINGDKATLRNGEIPEAGVKVNAAHHKFNLNIDKNSKITGTIESKNTKYGKYCIKIKNGKVQEGEYIHKGNNHQMKLSLKKEGVQLAFSSGKGNKRWGVNLSKDQKEVKAFGNLKFSF